MATKDHRRLARGLIEALECRIHAGPPVQEAEVRSAREFLCQNDFSLASDDFQRLEQPGRQVFDQGLVGEPLDNSR